jgi:hypothetical protein
MPTAISARLARDDAGFAHLLVAGIEDQVVMQTVPLRTIEMDIGGLL